MAEKCKFQNDFYCLVPLHTYNPAFDNSLGLTLNRLTLCILTNISLTFCLLTIKSLTSFRVTVHNGRKDHKCDSCAKAFSEAGSLKTHINSVHNGQKDYKCDICGKAFSQAGSLNTHINSVHNGQKINNA